MGLVLKALIALVVGVVVAFIVGQVCKHFGFDLFFGWLIGVIAGILFFLYGNINQPTLPR
jgi:hypothetical protein